MFAAPPVIIGDSLVTKAAGTGKIVIYTFMVYSPSVFNITLHRSRMTTCLDNGISAIQYDYNILPTVVNLPLFGQEVKTVGFHCTLSITVNTNYDFGYYVLGVRNTVGETTNEVKIVAEGKCQYV